MPVIPSGTTIVYPQQLMPVLASEERDIKAIDVAAVFARQDARHLLAGYGPAAGE